MVLWVSKEPLCTQESPNESLEAFENKFKQNYMDTKVEARDRLYLKSGYEQLVDQTKLFIKVKDKSEVLAAVRNMKSDTTFLRKMPIRRTKP